MLYNKLLLTFALSPMLAFSLMAQPMDDLPTSRSASPSSSPTSASSEAPSTEEELNELLDSFLLRKRQIIGRKKLEYRVTHGGVLPAADTPEWTHLDRNIDSIIILLADNYASDLIALIYRHRIRLLPSRYLDGVPTTQFLRITANLLMEDLTPIALAGAGADVAFLAPMRAGFLSPVGGSY